MKVYNEKIKDFSNIIANSLLNYRKQRSFDPENYLLQKVNIINSYFNDSGLDTAVVALSGGIDSALVLAILNKVKEKNKALKNIVPITLPALSNTGVTNQSASRNRAKELTDLLGYNLLEIDLSNGSALIGDSLEKQIGVEGGDWAKGQFVPYLRTSTLYYLTSLLSQQGNRAVLVGTTNADEGQYLGYIGKASDGMVDIQPISDLHKSEVYTLSRYLNIPESIIGVTPTGDMYDGRTDEEVFGTSYDNVEFYYNYLKMTYEEKDELLNQLRGQKEEHIFEDIQKNIENLHRYNMHKYLGCSPAVHLDVYPMKIVGGWKYFNYGE